MPMANTNPNSEMLFKLNPSAAITANVLMMATGTAISGMITDRQFCKNTSTTAATSDTAMSNVFTTSVTDSRINGVVSYAMV